MIGFGFALARPLLTRLDPETAHHLTLKLLKTGLLPRAPSSDDRLRVDLWDLKFPNPLGLAAGFHITCLLALPALLIATWPGPRATPKSRLPTSKRTSRPWPRTSPGATPRSA